MTPVKGFLRKKELSTNTSYVEICVIGIDHRLNKKDAAHFLLHYYYKKRHAC